VAAAIMQPTYLPWAGYFNLIGRVSSFVFLDDVQFAKPSWQMRNRILHRGSPHFLTVPTQGSRHQALSDVHLSGDTFRSQHQKTLEHTYGKHPYGREMLDAVLPVLSDLSLERLVDLNVALIVVLCRGLGLEPPSRRASEFGAQGKRSSHLLEILEACGERCYLSPEGSREYIAQERVLEAAGISVEYQDFVPAPYPQRGSDEFVPRLSIVDAIAHLGWAGARRYVIEPETFAEQEGQIARAVARENPGLFSDHLASSRL
jgi:hypothetical protein